MGHIANFRLSFFQSMLLGRTVHAFSGAANESNLQELIDALLKMGGAQNANQIIRQANEFLKDGKVSEASEMFVQLLQNPKLKAEALAISGLSMLTHDEKIE